MPKPNTGEQGHYNHDEDLKIPTKPGEPPRHATEPDGAEASTETTKTAANPVTGEPNLPRRRH